MITVRCSHLAALHYICSRELRRPFRGAKNPLTCALWARCYSDQKPFHKEQGGKRFSLAKLQKDRFWTEIAGLDPRKDTVSAYVWSRYRDVLREAYHDTKFDVATSWTDQSIQKKDDAVERIRSALKNDLALNRFPGLQHQDLILFRLWFYHTSLGRRLQNMAGVDELDSEDPRVMEALESLRVGRRRLQRKPHTETLEILAQRSDQYSSRDETRQYTNERKWEKERHALVQEPHDPEKDLEDIAQSSSKSSASAKRRWQRWRKALRAGEIPVDTRLRTVNSRLKQAQSTKERLSKIEYTPGQSYLMIQHVADANSFP